MTEEPRLEVVEVGGSAAERGTAFGFARAKPIAAWTSAWLASLSGSGVDNPLAYVRSFLQETDFASAVSRHVPDLRTEIDAVAAASGMEPEIAFAAQCMDEEWAYRQERLGAPVQHKCSSAAVLAQGQAHIGQNMDLGSWTDGHQVVLIMQPHGRDPGACIFTMGAMIGLMGVNSRGVGVCVNALSTLAHARSGVPVAFVIRRLLQAASVDEAATWLRALPHATGQHYLLADAGSVRSFEASPDGVFEYRSGYERRVLHTNHPLAEGARSVAARDETNTRTRLACLVARLGTGPAGLDDIKAALSSKDDPRHPVCRTGKTDAGLVGFTTGSMVSTLSRGAPGLDTWISPGPPCIRGYVHLQREMPA